MRFVINGHNIFLIIFACTLASFLFVELMKKVSYHVGALDYPNARKVHIKPMPTLGGIGIFLAFLLGYILFCEPNTLMISILISSFLVLMLGIFDDIKPIPAKYKFIVQIVIGCIIVFYGGLQINNINIFNFSLDLKFIAPIFSIFVIVGTINAINLMDGLDGLCGGISSIYFLTIGIIGLLLNKIAGMDVILSFIMFGSTLGFLIHNFPPAKIFMGDTGSTFLGLMISIIMMLGFKTYTLTSFIIPIVILIIPILDTTFAIIRRKINHKSIGEPDKQHFHHQLLKMNNSKTKTVLMIYLINIVFSVATIFYAIGYHKEIIIIYALIVFLVLFLILKTDIIFERKRK